MMAGTGAESLPVELEPLLGTVARLWSGTPVEDEDANTSGRAEGGTTAVRWTRASSPAKDAAREFVVMPRASAPRLLIPVERRPAATALQRFNADITRRETAQRLVLGGLIRLVGTSPFRDRVVIDRSIAGGLDEHLSQILGTEVFVSIGIGTARANRKPVLGVFDRRGRSIAYAKVGDSPLARHHVTTEAASLRTVAERSWRVIEPPGFISFTEWQGMCVLVMSPLVTSARRGRRGSEDVPDGAVEEIATAFGTRRCTLGETPMWANCLDTPSEIEDPQDSERLADVLGRLDERLAAREVTEGAWHGDFGPWNMSWRGHRLQLWDWERFETGVVVGMDRAHYCVNVRARQLGYEPDIIMAALSWALPSVDDAGSDDFTIAAAYIASMACRFLGGAQAGGGEPRTLVKARHLLDVLEQLDRRGAARVSEG